MDMQPGVVSTIIPVFNRPALLADAVQSVLDQTHRPIEIVIVDDGSTDETGRIGQAFANRLPGVVQYVRQAQAGVSSARNAGLRHVRGEFVQFLDSDDLLMPDKFASQVAGLRRDPGCGISYCYTREYVLGEPPVNRPARRTAQSLTHLFPDILSGKIWPAPAPLYRRGVVDANGPFRDLSIYEDWEYEARAGARGVRLHHCPELLADKRNAHRDEGRRKGGVTPTQLHDYAEVHERMFGYAREAGVPAAALDCFARRLFAVARQCAEAGCEADARRMLALGQDAAATRLRRQELAAYAWLSNRLGWSAVGRRCARVEGSRFARAVRAAGRWPAACSARWRHRARVASATISGEPVSRWTGLLWQRWSHRQSRRPAGS